MSISPEEYLKIIIVSIEKLALTSLPITPIKCCCPSFSQLIDVPARHLIQHVLFCPFHQLLKETSKNVLNATFLKNMQQVFLVRIPTAELFNLIHDTKKLLGPFPAQSFLEPRCLPCLQVEAHFHLLVTITRQIVREII